MYVCVWRGKVPPQCALAMTMWKTAKNYWAHRITETNQKQKEPLSKKEKHTHTGTTHTPTERQRKGERERGIHAQQWQFVFLYKLRRALVLSVLCVSSARKMPKRNTKKCKGEGGVIKLLWRTTICWWTQLKHQQQKQREQQQSCLVFVEGVNTDSSECRAGTKQVCNMEFTIWKNRNLLLNISFFFL